MSRTVALALLVAVGGVAAAAGQPAIRRATTVEALRLYPGFFNGQPVVVRGELATDGDHVVLRAGDVEIRVVGRDTLREGRDVEIRGQLVDVGRMKDDDPRIQMLGLQPLVEALYKDRWPKPGEALLLQATSAEPASPPPAPSVRSLALDPRRYEGQRVTLVGQFRGRNLFGDLPDAPAAGGRRRNASGFILRSADAALWVVGLKPKGKGFDLNVDARVDTGRWLAVSGVVRHGHGLVWIEGQQIDLAKPPTDETLGSEVAAIVPAPPAPPIEVVFSSPVQDDSDVPRERPVRIQFSRNIDAASLVDRVRVTYLAEQSRERGEPQPPAIEVSTAYDTGTRALILTPARVFERFRTVRVELLEGIVGTDGGTLKPFTLVFATGGS